MPDPFKLFKKWSKGVALNKLRKRNGDKRSNPKPDSSEKSKVIRRLKHRTEYLVEEEKYVKELKSKATAQFHAAIIEYCKENAEAVSPLKQVETKKPEKKDNPELPEEMKLLYREIAKITHPDKRHEDQDAMIEIFREATAAKDEQKLEELINISFGLDIDISEISIELFDQIEKDLNEKENRIVNMRSDSAIVWYQANKERQDKLIKRICPIPMTEPKKEDDDEKK
tara:strand:+ start:420 stop:1100 length:681 start_codon:yes stop_codon:yes gene_type:complete